MHADLQLEDTTWEYPRCFLWNGSRVCCRGWLHFTKDHAYEVDIDHANPLDVITQVMWYRLESGRALTLGFLSRPDVRGRRSILRHRGPTLRIEQSRGTWQCWQVPLHSLPEQALWRISNLISSKGRTHLFCES